MKRRFVAWLAVFGIAFNALWPLLANAAPVDLQMTICTTDKSAQAAQSAPGKTNSRQQLPAALPVLSRRQRRHAGSRQCGRGFLRARRHAAGGSHCRDFRRCIFYPSFRRTPRPARASLI
jgi:hypothetical protein